jgi:hypothetical protein
VRAARAHAPSFWHVRLCHPFFDRGAECVRFLLEWPTDVADAPGRHRRLVSSVGLVDLVSRGRDDGRALVG